MSTLILDAANELLMRKHALEAFPNECCGFFFGTKDPMRVVTHVMTVVNAKEGDQRRRFEISPSDYMKAERFALTHNLSLLGIYHSHPLHPAIPSEHDRLAAQPTFSYIILSVFHDHIADITSWMLGEDGQFFRETILTGSSTHSNRA
jgi:proteasome lid subunit RPN8/RPN11